MKKMTFFAVMLLAATAVLSSCGAKRGMSSNSQPSYYQNSTPSNSKPLSGPEGKVREWESKGYEIAGNNGLFTMYDCAKDAYDKLRANRDKYILVSGVGQHKTSQDAAHNAALLNAIQYYAASAGSEVKGRFDREYGSMTDIDKLVTAYSGNIAKKLTSYMNEELAVRRKTENGYEMEVWFTLDESKMKLLREQAMDQAIQETAVEQTIGNAIREYVNDAVPGNL